MTDIDTTLISMAGDDETPAALRVRHARAVAAYVTRRRRRMEVGSAEYVQLRERAMVESRGFPDVAAAQERLDAACRRHAQARIAYGQALLAVADAESAQSVEEGVGEALLTAWVAELRNTALTHAEVFTAKEMMDARSVQMISEELDAARVKQPHAAVQAIHQAVNERPGPRLAAAREVCERAYTALCATHSDVRRLHQEMEAATKRRSRRLLADYEQMAGTGL